MKPAVLQWVVSTFALTMVALAIIGGVNGYSPVPFWDMWDGVLDFNLRLSEGDSGAWLSQYHEHRILLARVLFWLDYQLFGARHVFLVICNYLLVGITVLVFYAYILRSHPRRSGRLLAAMLLAWMFLWVQRENFSWAFQSQFFLVQLLPLSAFYALARSTQEGQGSWFALACLLGGLSPLAMANGLLVLPGMTLYALMVGLRGRWIIVLMVLSVLVTGLYLHGYHKPDFHGTPLSTLLEDPVGLSHFTLLYLGSPFYYLAGGEALGQRFALAAGAMLCCLSAGLLWRQLAQWLRHGKPDYYSLALLFFIGFIFLTAAVTAGGRLVFGLEQALVSRYTTPAVAAFAALLLVIAAGSSKLDGWWEKPWVIGPFVFLMLLMLRVQLAALTPDETFQNRQDVAALALAMGVDDAQSIQHTFPSSDYAQYVGERALRAGVSIFGRPPYRGLRRQLGQPVTLRNGASCDAQMTSYAFVPGAASFLRVRSTVREMPVAPVLLTYANADSKAAGFAIRQREGRDPGLDESVPAYEYLGYLGRQAMDGPVSVQAGMVSCPLRKPGAPESSMLERLTWIETDGYLNVSEQDIAVNSGWRRLDNPQSEQQAVVYTTQHGSATARPSLTLVVGRDARLLFMSGPVAGSQRIDLGEGRGSTVLPAVPDWTPLEFSDGHMPERIRVQIVDADGNPGAWSAIAVQAGGLD